MSSDDQEDCEKKVGDTSLAIRSPKINLFDAYTETFQFLTANWVPQFYLLEEENCDETLSELILPSNNDWRHQVYYKLVELQRENDSESVDNETKGEKKYKDWEWSPQRGGEEGEGGEENWPKIRTKKYCRSEDSLINQLAMSSVGGSMTEAFVNPGWKVEDIILAAKILYKGKPLTRYNSETEMRRVCTLVYDVLRFRDVLSYALEDTAFWYRHRSLKNRERIVWLLLYDMQRRKFSRHGDLTAIEARNKLLKAAGLIDIEEALLQDKTHLAASIARLRIAGSALTLDKLLPKHLQNGDNLLLDGESDIVSGWINTANGTISKDEIMIELYTKVGLQHCDDCDVVELNEDNYVFDLFCPKVINMHERAREKVAASDLVREHRFICLERSLCLGAAALARAMRTEQLCGPVILTHSMAPRHTGYLAELLADVEGAGRLLAFGTGDRRYEYEAYLKDLGVTLQQCRVYSEKYISPPPSAELERAAVVLATPPCSYVGVKDIVDLVVARGGDTDLLEAFTNPDNEFAHPRAVLAEQMATLKYALTRPNVQFLIYEAHTVVPSETTEMVQTAVEYANRLATEKYIRENPPKKKGTLKSNKGTSTKSKHRKSSVDHQKENVENMEKKENEIHSISAKVPKVDLFEIGKLDDIYGENCTRLLDPGCFLTVVKRKEMMQFDSFFMIQVAETKGLFGDMNKERETEKVALLPTIPLDAELQYTKQKSLEIATEESLDLTSFNQEGVDAKKSESITFFQKFQESMGKIFRNTSAPYRWGRFEVPSSSRVSLNENPPPPRKYRMGLRKTVPQYIRKEVPQYIRKEVPQRAPPKTYNLNWRLKEEVWNLPSTSQSNQEPVKVKRVTTNPEEKVNFPLSTALREPALIRATRRTALTKILEEREKETSLEGIERRARMYMNFPKMTKLHRLNSIGYPLRAPFRSRLETVVEHSPGFPYLFPPSMNSDQMEEEEEEEKVNQY